MIVGEIHGTEETPDAFAELACLAAASGRPVTVALDQPVEDQQALDAWLASDGGPRARAAVLRRPIWRQHYQDGRSSVAMLRLLDTHAAHEARGNDRRRPLYRRGRQREWRPRRDDGRGLARAARSA